GWGVREWCLPHVWERVGFGRGRLQTGATRQARRRQPSRLLLTTNSRCRHRFVKPDGTRFPTEGPSPPTADGCWLQVEDQGTAYQTEGDARRDERNQHTRHENCKDNE